MGSASDDRASVLARWLSRVKRSEQYAPGACWEWTGPKRDSKGGALYGLVFFSSQGRAAHRAIYEAMRGPVDPALDLDHLCRNTLCVNPDHLEPVTHRVNVLRGASPVAENARKTHCRAGHPYAGDNVRVNTDGSRTCRTCDREAWHRKNPGRARREPYGARPRCSTAKSAIADRAAKGKGGGE